MKVSADEGKRVLRVQSSIAARFGAFVLERYPFAAAAAASALESLGPDALSGGAAIESARKKLPQALRRVLAAPPPELPETTPAVAASARWSGAVDDLIEACDGFLRRAAIALSLTAEERREILRGMALTRATDNRLKQFFTGGEVRYGSGTFQGKGFRSLGQEAIYAAAIRLRRSDDFVSADGWKGDVVSPMIRDLGVVLAMHNDRSTVRMVLSAQMAKAGPPMNGKDLHVGDWDHGILPAMAPLGSPALNIAGIAMAFKMRESGIGSRESESDALDRSDPRSPTPGSRVA